MNTTLALTSSFVLLVFGVILRIYGGAVKWSFHPVDSHSEKDIVPFQGSTTQDQETTSTNPLNQRCSSSYTRELGQSSLGLCKKCSLAWLGGLLTMLALVKEGTKACRSLVWLDIHGILKGYWICGEPRIVDGMVPVYTAGTTSQHPTPVTS